MLKKKELVLQKKKTNGEGKKTQVSLKILLSQVNKNISDDV